MVLKLGYLGRLVRCMVLENISWAVRVRNKELLQRVKEDRTNLNIIKKRKTKWIGHSLRRNCLLEHVIEERIKVRDRSDGKTRKKR